LLRSRAAAAFFTGPSRRGGGAGLDKPPPPGTVPAVPEPTDRPAPAAAPPRPPPAAELWRHAPILAVAAWWIYDLQVHWRGQVEYQYGWIVVMLVGYLVWDRWPTLPAAAPLRRRWLPGALAAAGAPLVLVAELYKHGVANTPAASFLLSLGCTAFILAMLLVLHGPRAARHLLFPLLFMFVAVPIPKLVWNPVVFGLQSLITFLNVEALNMLGIAAVQSVNVIQLPNGVVGVDEACSGVRSLQSSIMAALFIGDLTLRRRSAKLFFLASGVALAVVGNFFRSLYLSLTAHHRGVDAVDVVHDTAGWSILIFTAGGLILMAMVVTRMERLAAQMAAEAKPAAG
jgi:exosortase